jgi:poly(hydroxyalkanoate) depolymerase family esterase
MVRLSSTVARLAKLHAASHPSISSHSTDRLTDIASFGANPGALLARTYVPAGLPSGAPLVVVLHGCTQTASGYDHGAGWSQLADELGFALLFPQQQRSNNPHLCFNWFSPVDARRGSGEALSIRQMIAAMVAAHDIDESRIFITGLSAGGAMTSIMLATYPEVFAGGAIIAGLAFGAATSVNDAFLRMRGEGYPSDAHLADAIRGASQHKGPWPRLSVWHGSADQTVAASNAEKIIGQWRIVHGLTVVDAQQDTIEGSRHRVWHDGAGDAVLEAYEIPGMGHGTPLRTGGPGGCGASAPFMLEAGISSTRHIASFWGLINRGAVRQECDAVVPSLLRRGASAAEAKPVHHLEPLGVLPDADKKPKHGGVGAIIENALRQAGLMR